MCLRRGQRSVGRPPNPLIRRCPSGPECKQALLAVCARRLGTLLSALWRLALEASSTAANRASVRASCSHFSPCCGMGLTLCHLAFTFTRRPRHIRRCPPRRADDDPRGRRPRQVRRVGPAMRFLSCATRSCVGTYLGIVAADSLGASTQQAARRWVSMRPLPTMAVSHRHVWAASARCIHSASAVSSGARPAANSAASAAGLCAPGVGF